MIIIIACCSFFFAVGEANFNVLVCHNVIDMIERTRILAAHTVNAFDAFSHQRTMPNMSNACNTCNHGNVGRIIWWKDNPYLHVHVLEDIRGVPVLLI